MGYIVGLKYALIICCGSVAVWWVIVPAISWLFPDLVVSAGSSSVTASQASAEQIFQYAKSIGIGGIAMAGIIGIFKSRKIIMGAVGLAAQEMKGKGKSDTVVPRTQKDLPMKIIAVGSLLTLAAILLFFYFGVMEGNLLFITEPLAEQLNGFPGMADKPVKAGETATEAFVARLAAISDEQWKAFLSKTAADDEQEAARRLAPVAAACTDIGCDGIYVSVNPLGNGETHRLLAVVFGSDTRETLDRAAGVFLREGHLRYKTATVIRNGEAVGRPPVFKGEAQDVTLVTHENVVVTIAKTMTLSKDSEAFKMHLTRQQPVIAPVDAETPLGTLSIWLNGKCLRSVPVYAKEPVKEGSLWQRVRDTIILTTTDINEAEKSR